MSHWLDDQAVESEDEEQPKLKRSRVVDEEEDEEEDEEDDERANEEMKGFIVNEDEDEEGDEDEKELEEDSPEELEEEDQELLQENLGYKITKKSRRVRVYTDSEGSDNEEESVNKAELKRSLFPVDEISNEDRQKSTHPSYSKSSYDQLEGSQSSGSELEDFIQYDEEEEQNRAAVKRTVQKQRLPVSDRALEEARDLFDIGFNVEEFYGEDEELEGEEEEEAEYEDDFEDLDDEERKMKASQRRRRTQKKTLLEEIEPSELERGFLSDFDKRVQLEDKPERFQLRSVPVTAASNDELLAEARWIHQKVFSGNSITRQSDYSRNLPMSAVEKIKNVLNLIRNQEFEVPFIAFYRKEYVQPELTINDLWSIYNWDEKWCHLQNRRQNLCALFNSIKDYHNELRREGRLDLSMRLITDEDIDAVNRVQSSEELQDMHLFFVLYYSAEVQKMVEHKKLKNILNDRLDAADEAEQPSHDFSRPVAGRNRYQICVDAGLLPLAEEIGLTPREFAENMQAGYNHHELRQHPLSFDQLAEQHICKQFSTVAAVRNATKHMIALQLSREPLVRQIVREDFVKRSVISIRPTSMGRKEIDEAHVMYPYKYIKDKLVRELKRDEYLLYLQAKDNHLINIQLKCDTKDNKEYYDELLERRVFRADREDSVGDDWNQLRDEILKICISDMLLPVMERELLNRLLEEAHNCVLRRSAARMQDWLRVGPYSLNLEADKQDDVQFKPLILGVAYPLQQDQATFVALVDKHGEVTGYLRLPHLVQFSRPNKTEEQNDWTKLKKFISRRPPIAIAIAAESLHAVNLKRNMETAVAELLTDGSLSESIPIELVDDELAKVFSNSLAANREFPEYPIVLRQAISIARRLNDPLIEFAQLCNLDDEILYLKFHPLQDYVPKEELLKVITLEFINRTNEVGVDMNRCVEHPYTACLLQFVCGLGPRKATYLLKLLRLKEGPIESRTQLVTECHMAPKVFLNCSGFIRIDPRFNSYRTADHDVLDCSRVHPSTYEWARKMAEDALEYDSEETGSNRSPLDEILEAPERLKSLDLDAFAEELMRQGFGNMQIALYDIRAELIHRYKDLRDPFRPPTNEQLLYMLIKENAQSFSVGKLTLGRVVRVVYKRPPKGRDENLIPTRAPMTNLWMCSFCKKDDFSELSELWTHYDMEQCPGQAVGVRVRLENGLMGFIRVKMLSDSATTNTCEQLQPGTTLVARIVSVDFNRMSADLTCRTSDLEDREFQYRPQRDAYYDYAAEEEDRRVDRANKASRKKCPFVKRLIVHPSFQNCSCKEAEEQLADMEQGEVIIRPSSKGVDYLTLTWKVTDNICQHILIKEENKENSFSLGKTLVVDDEIYDDLDELIYRRVQPTAIGVREILNHKYYCDSNGGDRGVIEKMLTEEKKKNPNRIPYLFSASKEFPGKFFLSYMPGSRVRHEFITALPKGFKFRGRVHLTINGLVKWFKEHFRDPVPSARGAAAAERIAGAQLLAGYDSFSTGAYLAANLQNPWSASAMTNQAVVFSHMLLPPNQTPQYTMPRVSPWNSAMMPPPPPPPPQPSQVPGTPTYHTRIATPNSQTTTRWGQLPQTWPSPFTQSPGYQETPAAQAK